MISFVTIMISLEHDYVDIGGNYQYNVNDCDDFDDYCDGISDDRAEIGKLACKMYIGEDYDDFNDNYYDIGNDCTIWKQLRLLKLR